MMKLEVKNELGEVYYTSEFKEKEGWQHNNWYGYINAEDVVKAVTKHLEVYPPEKLKVAKILNDSSKGEGSWDEANEWLSSNWMPNAIANGLKKFAYIVSPDIFSAMSSEDLSTKVPEAGFEMRTFNSVAEAEAWLRA